MDLAKVLSWSILWIIAMSSCSVRRQDYSRLSGATRQSTGIDCSGDLGSKGVDVLSVVGDRGGEEAYVFLTGQSSICKNGTKGCSMHPGLHPREDWSGCRLHSEGYRWKDYTPYFVDEKYRLNEYKGDDNNSMLGLENGRLVFYTGEGTGEGVISTSNKGDVKIVRMSLGDSNTRYLWLSSCQIMIHGPIADGSEPWNFNPSGGGLDVFRRWGWKLGVGGGRTITPLNRNLRMVCGGSTLIGGGEFLLTNRIWENFRVRKLPVSDSFILGMAPASQIPPAVPLCISWGGGDPESSSLYEDRDFSWKYPAGGGYMHIQYPVFCENSSPRNIFDNMIDDNWQSLQGAGFDSFEIKRNFDEFFYRDEADSGSEFNIPGHLPIFLTEAVDIPPALEGVANEPVGFGFLRGKIGLGDLIRLNYASDSELVSDSELINAIFDEVRLDFEYNSTSGATILSWQKKLGERTDVRLEVILFLWGMLRNLDDAWKTTNYLSLGSPLIRQMRFDRVSSSTNEVYSAGSFECSRGCWSVEWPLIVNIDGNAVPVFGGSGRWFFRICPGTDMKLPSLTCGAEGMRENRGIGCNYMGNAELHFSIPRWRIVQPLSSIAATDEAVVDEVEAKKRLEYALSEREDGPGFISDIYDIEKGFQTPEPGYRAAPLHCAQGVGNGGKIFPVVRYNIPRKISNGESAEASLVTVEISALKAISRIEDEWNCPEAGESSR